MGWLFSGWGEAIFWIFVLLKHKWHSGAFLMWLYCLWMMRWCSICRCHRRWCQWTLVVAQLASWTGYQSSSALRLCVPHACHSPLLCWPASSEAEAVFLTSNILYSLSLLPYHFSAQKHPLTLSPNPSLPFFIPSHHRGAVLASAFAVCCLVSTPDLCLDRIIASHCTFIFR